MSNGQIDNGIQSETSVDVVVDHRVIAQNLSEESENKIHSDDVAKQYGFEGALVGGVHVYGYMSHLAVDYYGPEWLSRGWAECRFLKPVYDGHETRCFGFLEGEGLSLRAEMAGITCGTGRAWLPDHAPDFDDPIIPAAPYPREEDRPIGSPDSLEEGKILGTYDITFSTADNNAYCSGVGETLDIYQSQNIKHPGAVLQMANRALAGNVYISPWIHVGSEIQNYAPTPIDTPLSARAKVLREYERKGHRFVELDVMILAGADQLLSRIHHTAIYRPRGT